MFPVSCFSTRVLFSFWLIYSDSSQLALKYLKNTEINIHNVMIMIDNFNIRNSLWDSNFPFHSSHSDTLFNMTDLFSLEISKPTENLPTRFSDNDQDSDSILDLVFLWPFSSEFNNYHIYPDWRLLSDYVPITIDASISDEHISIKQWSLLKGSDEESLFFENLIQSIKNLNTLSIQNSETLKEIIQNLLIKIKNIWFKHSRTVNITRHSKA